MILDGSAGFSVLDDVSNYYRLKCLNDITISQTLIDEGYVSGRFDRKSLDNIKAHSSLTWTSLATNSNNVFYSGMNLLIGRVDIIDSIVQNSRIIVNNTHLHISGSTFHRCDITFTINKSKKMKGMYLSDQRLHITDFITIRDNLNDVYLVIIDDKNDISILRGAQKWNMLEFEYYLWYDGKWIINDLL